MPCEKRKHVSPARRLLKRVVLLMWIEDFTGSNSQRLFKFFPRDQVKAVKFEDFKEKQRETLTSIFSFLGLEPLRSVRSKDRNIVPYERAMNWEEKVFLYNLFEEDIAKLEQLLGWDCANWKL